MVYVMTLAEGGSEDGCDDDEANEDTVLSGTFLLLSVLVWISFHRYVRRRKDALNASSPDEYVKRLNRSLKPFRLAVSSLPGRPRVVPTAGENDGCHPFFG